MSRPRVFVSSTHYDLKHVRSSLGNFIESLGYDSVLSEKGSIPYSPDAPLDESCYREAANADILVLIMGGRYGSETSTDNKKPEHTFFEIYDSITKKEYESACSRDIPVYILIEGNVYTEYHTYLRNKTNEKIEYAHVDSVNIFRLIEDILSKPRNNPIHTFEHFSEIESWLREQWAGLFGELLQRMTSQQQISTLSNQVETLSAINITLQRYLEALVTKASPDDAPELIQSEHKRLDEIKQLDALRQNKAGMIFAHKNIDIEQYRQALLNTETLQKFSEKLSELADDRNLNKIWSIYIRMPSMQKSINEARTIVGKKPFPLLTSDK